MARNAAVQARHVNDCCTREPTNRAVPGLVEEDSNADFDDLLQHVGRFDLPSAEAALFGHD